MTAGAIGSREGLWRLGEVGEEVQGRGGGSGEEEKGGGGGGGGRDKTELLE